MFGAATTAVLIPCVADEGFIVDYYPPNLADLTRSETAVPFQANGTKPELGFVPISSHVHVLGLGTVKAVEEEPVRSRNPANTRHSELAFTSSDRSTLSRCGRRIRARTRRERTLHSSRRHPARQARRR